MQSGTAKTKSWVLDFEQASPKAVEPLMGWTSSSDMRQQVRLRFDSKDEAIAYCERNGIPYRVFDANPPKRRVMAYADNFARGRRCHTGRAVPDFADAQSGLHRWSVFAGGRCRLAQ